MSKLYEILNSSRGEIADLIRPILGENDAAQAQPTPAPKAGAAPAAAQPQPAPASAAPDPAPASPDIRTVSLSVAAPSPLLPFEDGQWRPNEQYRILRTKISQHPKQPRLMVVSSPAPGDGKTVNAINIAAVLSLKSEARVLLIDADFRKSAIHGRLGIPEAPGLTDLLKGACTLEDAVVRAQEFPNLFILRAGTPASNPVELLDSAPWRTLCERLRGLFRYIVLDSPPVGAIADYDLIQAVADGVILVLRPDHTHRKLCERALEAIPKSKFLGVLLNCVPDWKPARHAGAEYYYYSGKQEYRKREAEAR